MISQLFPAFGYTPPEIYLRVHEYKKPRAGEVAWGKKQRCISNEPGGGMTNGMPWKGTSEVSAPTEIDCHKSIPTRAIGPMKLWSLASSGTCSWRSVAERIEVLAVNVHRNDPGLAGDLDLLAEIATRRESRG